MPSFGEDEKLKQTTANAKIKTFKYFIQTGQQEEESAPGSNNNSTVSHQLHDYTITQFNNYTTFQ